MLHVGQNNCKCFMWARTTANASCGPEQLQMLHVGQNNCKCFMWARTTANASCGPEQLQMLHVGQNNCKCLEAEQDIYTKLELKKVNSWARTASCKCFTWASTMGQYNERAPACCILAVQQVYTENQFFFKMNET